MVLPVPNPETLKFIDLSNYKDLLDDCEKAFYSPKIKGLNMFVNTNLTEETLNVFSVGSY